MKMPVKIEDAMFAPCGMNCAVCYKHVNIQKNAKHCEGCLKSDIGKPEHCRKCNIKICVQQKGCKRCFECNDFPCKLIKNLEKSYNKRYGVSLIENNQTTREKGVAVFLEQDRLKWTCAKCSGAFSLHDGACSECGNTRRPE